MVIWLEVKWAWKHNEQIRDLNFFLWADQPNGVDMIIQWLLIYLFPLKKLLTHWYDDFGEKWLMDYMEIFFRYYVLRTTQGESFLILVYEGRNDIMKVRG